MNNNQRNIEFNVWYDVLASMHVEWTITLYYEAASLHIVVPGICKFHIIPTTNFLLMYMATISCGFMPQNSLSWDISFDLLDVIKLWWINNKAIVCLN